jgi:hypothetical protein
MTRRNAGAPPARRIVVAAMTNGGKKFVRRLILSFVVFSALSVLSAFYTTAIAARSESVAARSEAAATAVAPAAAMATVGAMQDPIAAWSCRGFYHVVGRGETIYSIARRYGTTAYRIAVCNGLASYTVYVGQTLLVPTARS